MSVCNVTSQTSSFSRNKSNWSFFIDLQYFGINNFWPQHSSDASRNLEVWEITVISPLGKIALKSVYHSVFFKGGELVSNESSWQRNDSELILIIIAAANKFKQHDHGRFKSTCKSELVN